MTWLGPEIMAKVTAAAIHAIDETTEAAAEDAKANHWWSERTGNLERNTFAEPAHFDGANVTGRFGSSMRAQGFYGLFLERKTPWLRPAADRHFRNLKSRLRGLRWT
jgi:hypothetical protein